MNKKINFVAILLVSFIFTITLIITYDKDQSIFHVFKQGNNNLTTTVWATIEEEDDEDEVIDEDFEEEEEQNSNYDNNQAISFLQAR